MMTSFFFPTLNLRREKLHFLLVALQFHRNTQTLNFYFWIIIGFLMSFYFLESSDFRRRNWCNGTIHNLLPSAAITNEGFSKKMIYKIVFPRETASMKMWCDSSNFIVHCHTFYLKAFTVSSRIFCIFIIKIEWILSYHIQTIN